MNTNELWIATFRRIPAELHDTLALGITTGAELIIQKILKIDAEYMVARGRVSGTTDPGRVLLIPYAQLTYVALGRVLVDGDVHAMFGQDEGAPAAALPSASEPAAPAAAEAATVNDAPAGVNPPKKKDAPSKTILLAKLRDRLKDAPAKK
jgi:hypothetical protein